VRRMIECRKKNKKKSYVYRRFSVEWTRAYVYTPLGIMHVQIYIYIGRFFQRDSTYLMSKAN